MFATDGTWRVSQRSAEVRRSPLELALAASIILLLVLAAFMAARRLGGALDSPLPAATMMATAGGLLAWAAAVRLRLNDWIVGWALAVVIALCAIACSYPGERTIDWLVWLPTFLALGLLPARRSSPARIASDTAAGLILQQLTRSRTADGVEVIRGNLVAEFAPGDRFAILHVAFCPPFEQLPAVEAERTSGPACEIKIAQILHQGARLEVRLSRASTSARSATIEFTATSPQPLAA